MPVPKSGSSKIKRKNNKISPNIGKTNLEVTLLRASFLSKYLDTKITKLSLLISLGWKPKEAIPNQLLLPFLTTPIPGINTNTNKINVNNNK